jgi:hypothetical protein
MALLLDNIDFFYIYFKRLNGSYASELLQIQV